MLKGLTIWFKYMSDEKLRSKSRHTSRDSDKFALERRVYAGSYVKQIAVRCVVSLKSTELCSCKTGSRDLACIYTYV